MDTEKRILFFDLEDTIIEPVLNGWHATNPCNIEKAKAFIEEFKPHQVHIFSFAIWNTRERAGFQAGTQPWLEELLGVKFQSIPTVDDEIIPAVCAQLQLPPSTMDFDDLSTFFGKHDSFRLTMRHLYKSNTTPVKLAFLDDAVYNETSVWPDLNVELQIVNIDQWKPNGKR